MDFAFDNVPDATSYMSASSSTLQEEAKKQDERGGKKDAAAKNCAVDDCELVCGKGRILNKQKEDRFSFDPLVRCRAKFN